VSMCRAFFSALSYIISKICGLELSTDFRCRCWTT